MSWECECVMCGTKMTFSDTRDINQAHWTILAWELPSGEPVCVCSECEYGKPKKKTNENTKK